MIFKPLSEVAKIDISGVNKKIDDGEKLVKLCNFTDVYYSWAVTNTNVASFMTASANDNEIERFKLKKGYVVITKDSETRDDIGIPCLIADNLENTILGYHCALIIPDENQLYGPYLNAYLNSKMARTYFSNQASGSGQRYTLTIGGIGNLKVPVIEMSKQIKIGDLFSKIDKKIENNKILISELQSIAMTLYDYWFLQFEFPNEEGKPYKSSGGKMVYNKELKREIPEGWKVENIDKHFDLISGYPFSSDNYCDFSNNKLYTIKNVQDGYIVSNVDTYIKTIPNNMEDECILKPKDLIMSLTGNVARVGLVYEQNCLLNQRVLKIKNKNSNYGYCYCLFRSNSIKTYLERMASGTSQKNLSPVEVGKTLFCVPSSIVMKKFSAKANLLIDKIVRCYQENQKLASLRDFLLPMLMNGQVNFK